MKNVRVGRYARIVLMMICLAFSGNALAQNAYICLVDKASGFSFNKGTRAWNGTHFNPSDKYLVKRSQPPDAWEVTKVGQDIAMSSCKNDFNDYGYLFCEGIQPFRMNRKNLRFLTAYLIGYVHDGLGSTGLGPEGSNTPSIEIGKCSPL
jgi:hypothetical protein